ncbi:hypothetical protein Tco_1126830 [Tanacetum coccineum]
MESSNSNLKERELQLSQLLVKQRQSYCMYWLEQLEIHLRDLYLDNSSHAIDAFKPAFHTFFGEEHETFRFKMFYNLDQLRLQLERENLHEVNAMTCLEALRTHSRIFCLQKGVTIHRSLLINVGNKISKNTRSANLKLTDVAYSGTWIDLNGPFLELFKLQSKDVQMQEGKVDMESSGTMLDEQDTSSRSRNDADTEDAVIRPVNDQVPLVESKDVQMQEGKVDMESSGNMSDEQDTSSRSRNDADTEDAVIRPVNDQVPLVESKDVQMQEGKVDMESSGTMSDEQDTSSRSRNDADTEDAVIRPVNDQVPLVEVQLTTPHNVLVNEQHHSVQSEPSYDTHLLEKVDSNTIPDSTNMCHRGGEIKQNAEKCQVSCSLLDPPFDNMTTKFSNQSLESENIFLKKTVAQLQKDFSRMEAHCVNMELKYQNQALKDGQRGQILNETSNKAKIKKEIEVLEKINIELEYSVAKLLTENEKLHKENEHLKQTYQDLYDSIKTTRVQTKDHNDSLIAQINSKTVENADLKALIQEKVFANVALKNELRKLKGNSVDTKFAKPSILGKPVLQPPRNQTVVIQPNAFKSK